MSDKSSEFKTSVDNSSRTSSGTMLFGENTGSDIRSKKRDAKAADKDDTRLEHSGKTNKSKNYNKRVNCHLCGKDMRSDHLKAHVSSKYCK